MNIVQGESSHWCISTEVDLNLKIMYKVPSNLTLKAIELNPVVRLPFCKKKHSNWCIFANVMVHKKIPQTYKQTDKYTDRQTHARLLAENYRVFI
jgi:hypothetical protein